MIDTPDGIAFAKAAARAGALSLEINTGLKKRGQTAYSIVKEVYGFRGSRQSVLDDLNEYIEAELRLRKLPDDVYKQSADMTQDVINKLGDNLTQQTFENQIYLAEKRGIISNGIRQAMSDILYVMIVRQNAGGR